MRRGYKPVARENRVSIEFLSPSRSVGLVARVVYIFVFWLIENFERRDELFLPRLVSDAIGARRQSPRSFLGP